MRKRPLQIRRAIYRGQPGFLIIGGPGLYGVRIFTLTRSSAERIRDKVRRGEQTTLDDFRP